MREQILTIAIITGALALAQTAIAKEPTFTEPFTDELKAHWSWVQGNDETRKISLNSLTVELTPGSWMGESNDGQNLLLRPQIKPSDEKSQTVTHEVTVTLHSGKDGNHAGLTLHHGPGEFVAIVVTRIKGVKVVALVQESKDKSTIVRQQKVRSTANIPVRLIRQQDEVQALFKSPDSGTWETLGGVTFKSAASAGIGLITGNRSAKEDGKALFGRFSSKAETATLRIGL